MRGLIVEVRGEIDDLHGLEGAFLHADAAPDAQLFRNLSDFRRGRDFDAEFAGDLARGPGAHAHDRARPLALLTTLFRLAFIRRHDGDTRHLIRLLLLLLLITPGFRHFVGLYLFSNSNFFASGFFFLSMDVGGLLNKRDAGEKK